MATLEIGSTQHLGLGAKRGIIGYLLVGCVGLLAMMVMGLLMLLSQGKVFVLSDATVYELLTMHGTGMIGLSSLAACAVMWYFLSQYVKLSVKILIANLVLAIVGVVLVIISIFGLHFAAAWTFLYPLPEISGGAWGKTAAAMYLSGMLLIGIGFLLFYLDSGRAILKRYGSFGVTLGWPWLTGKNKDLSQVPPKAVIASTMVTIVNTIAMAVGAAVIVMMIINVYNPAFAIDALFAKNMIYAFGHIIANAVIYMGIIAVYELLPKYTKREWQPSKLFLLSWNMSTLFTLVIYPHHLLMDFAMPKWTLVLAMILSYANGIPVLVVTAYGALMLIYRSGTKWDIASKFLFLSLFGWVAGVIPAIVDASINVNYVMHNTKWVPGHFHMYMGIGAVSMLFAFMYYLNKVDAGHQDQPIEKVAFWIYGAFFLGLAMTFLLSGASSVPRRWAVHMPEWTIFDKFGAAFAVLIILAVFVFVVRFVTCSVHMNKRQLAMKSK
ncbi:MAG TPA: cbb3-type cytochrome c oxidase subunit I [Bacilli bacterium]